MYWCQRSLANLLLERRVIYNILFFQCTSHNYIYRTPLNREREREKKSMRGIYKEDLYKQEYSSKEQLCLQPQQLREIFYQPLWLIDNSQRMSVCKILKRSTKADNMPSLQSQEWGLKIFHVHRNSHISRGSCLTHIMWLHDVIYLSPACRLGAAGRDDVWVNANEGGWKHSQDTLRQVSHSLYQYCGVLTYIQLSL